MGGSGGGSAGKVDYPDYMETYHYGWLDGMYDGQIPIAQAANPYTGLVAYDPDAYLGSMITAATDFLAYITSLGTAPDIAAAVAAFDVILTNQFAATSVAKFEAGMRSIGAVQSSSFVVGKALMFSRKDEQVAKYAAELSLSTMYKLVESRRGAYTMLMDGYRMAIVAKKEEFESQIELDVHEATWVLDIYHYGANMLGAIGGGMSMNPTRPGKVQSAIGGAMVGASVGTTVSPGYGTAIGAVIGGIGGYLSGS